MYEQISDTVRVEAGPVRVNEIADKATLRELYPRYQVGTPDAMGKVIEANKEMTILDRRSRVFYVYQMDESGRYQPMGSYADHDAAVAVAEALEG